MAPTTEHDYTGGDPSLRVVQYPPPTMLRWTLGWLSISAFTSALVFLPFSCLAVAVMTCRAPRVYGPVLAGLFALTMTPHRKWAFCEAFWCNIFQVWCELFHTTLIFEGGHAPPPKDFALLVHPHGVIPTHGFLIWGATWRHGLHPDHFAGSDAALGLPFFRQWLFWMGCVSAEKKKVVQTLKTKHSFSVFSGGIREMMLTDNDKEVLLLSPRVGIVQLAKEHGKAIVPVLAMGCPQHFRRWPSPNGASWLQRLSRRLRASLLIPYGRWGLPIPIYARTTLVFGEPMDTSTASVEELHQRWVAWYSEAWKRYSKAAGVFNRELVIL